MPSKQSWKVQSDLQGSDNDQQYRRSDILYLE